MRISKKRQKNEKGQVAMEFAITYGWSLLLMMIAFGLLYMFFFSKPNTINICQIAPPFICHDIKFTDNSVSFLISTPIDVKSAKIEKIIVKKFNNDILCNSINPVIIEKNNPTTITCILNDGELANLDKTSAEIIISYIEPLSVLPHKLVGIASGRIESDNLITTITISTSTTILREKKFGNDDIDNDELFFKAEENRKYVSKFNMPENGLVTKLSIYLDGNGNGIGQQVIRGIVYDDDGNILVCHFPPGNTGNPYTIIIPQYAVQPHLNHGDSLGKCSNDNVNHGNNPTEPYTLIAATDEVIIQDDQLPGWIDLTFNAPINLNAGNYWIGFIAGANADIVRYYYEPLLRGERIASDEYSDGPDNSFDQSSKANKEISIYATYN